MGTELIEGTEITLGGKQWIVPALNFARVKKATALIKVLNSVMPGEDMADEVVDAGTKLVHLALTRNYPELTIKQVEDMLDLRNFREVVAAIVGQAGFARKDVSGGA